MRHLLFFLLFLLSYSVFSTPSDSIGIRKVDSKHYVVHRVDPGETIYALSRRYGVSVSDINRANPNIAITDIAIGYELLIPAVNYSPKEKTGRTHKVQPSETLYSISRKYDVSISKIQDANPELNITNIPVGYELAIPSPEEEKKVQKGHTIHIVQPKETLYSLSKKYNVDIEEIKNSNPELKNNPLQIGQQLSIPGSPVSTPQAVEAKALHPEPQKKVSVKELPEKNAQINKVKETGRASSTAQKKEAPDLFCYHETAPVGTIIKVERGNKSTFVRVIGPLPEGTSSDILILLSPAAAEKLETNGSTSKVSLFYYTE